MNKKKIGPMERDSQLIVAKGGRNIFFTDVDLVRCQYSYIQLLTHTPVNNTKKFIGLPKQTKDMENKMEVR